MLLVGEKVKLREFRREDIPLVQAWVNDPEVHRYLQFWVAPQSLIGTEKFVESRMSANPEHEVDLAICLKDDPEETYIGSCGLNSIDPANRYATLGIVIGRQDLLGRGLGRDAILTLLDYAFNFRGLNKVNLSHIEFNERGHRCYEACGFTDEGRKRQRFFRDGRFWDEVMMGITREEYLARTRAATA